VTSKVVDAEIATELAGNLVTVNSDALAPLMVIAPKVKAARLGSEFVITKTFVIVPEASFVEPKLVWLAVDVVVAPLTILLPLPVTTIFWLNTDVVSIRNTKRSSFGN
jgi:hypothetical protein